MTFKWLYYIQFKIFFYLALMKTLDDYINFATILYNKCESNDNRIVSEKYINDMTTPQIPESMENEQMLWGLAVRIISDKNYDGLPVGAYE